MPFLERVQVLRDLMGIPFHLDKSGGGFYRCREYNKSIDGAATNSQHLLGRAMDISKHGWSGSEERQFVKWALAFDLSIIDYDRWFHVDLRTGDPVFRCGNK
jgi:hypothetical protein